MMARRHENYCMKAMKREIHDDYTTKYQRSLHVTESTVRRIGLEAELEGHTGCVNCLEWNETGTLLASGSDDYQMIIWNPFLRKPMKTIQTGHSGNIFSVKFLPNSNDSCVVTGAADCKVRVHDVTASETTQLFSCHAGRVKRIATAPNVSSMFWTAAEDGTIMQFDLRDPDAANSSEPRNVLINLSAHIGSQAEAKCLAINPLRPEQMAVGANDPYVRVYDRRMLTCKHIRFTTDSLTRLPWERPSVDPEMNSEDSDYSLPLGCVQYYVAGHLPPRQHDQQRRYHRTLASTYLTYSPSGTELLVNLGGEQIYLFNVNEARKPQSFDVPVVPAETNGIVKGSTSNGITRQRNGTTNGVSKHFMLASSSQSCLEERSNGNKPKRAKQCNQPLPRAIERLKQQANSVFEKEQYSQAIMIYNKALHMMPDSPVLLANRAAAYMKRKWDGDVYAALRDCHSAIRLDPSYLKAHFRLAKCLFELSWTAEALHCLQRFQHAFPEYAKTRACQTLDKDIHTAISNKREKKTSDKSDGDLSPHKSSDSISDDEQFWQKSALDYELRLCGHCNTTTDIKEANFFGSNGQYIMAGSDDGSFFVWDKNTTNIVRVLRGDDSIVNCLQPHPTYCMLATSGIDPVVRLWSPQPQDGTKNEREVDNCDDAASANQKRMNADPLEVMLMNMGYRIPGLPEGRYDDEQPTDGPVQCRTS